MYITGVVASEVNVTDVVVHNNTAGSAGGGFYVYHGTTTVQFTRVNVTGNRAVGVGGGMYANLPTLVFARVEGDAAPSFVFNGNRAGTTGGAMWLASVVSTSLSGVEVKVRVTDSLAQMHPRIIVTCSVECVVCVQC